jgi:hypothetical protein
MAVTVDDSARVWIVATQAVVPRPAAATAVAVRDDDFSAWKIELGDRRQIVENGALGGAPLLRRVVVAAHRDDFVSARRQRAKDRRVADISGVDGNVARAHHAYDAGVDESMSIRENGDANDGHQCVISPGDLLWKTLFSLA